MSDNPFPSFARLLKRHRESAHITQEELAQRSGLSARGISDLERGRRITPRLFTVRLLANALHLAEDDREALHAAALHGAQDATRSATSEPPTSPGPLSPGTWPNNLPTPMSRMLGREYELDAVCALLRRDDVRLVTLTGTGGIGKTRLGLQVAAEVLRDFPDGVWYIRLSRLTDHQLVIATIAAALDLKAMGVTPIADVLRTYLGEKRILLVLDNFEHVASAAGDIAAVLAACPGLTLLVTSRALLRLQGEHEFALRPLALPGPDERPSLTRLADYAAIALFVEQAQAVLANFVLTAESAPVVVAICEQLDGLPLAIQLAATHIKVLPPVALLRRLERRLSVLRGGASDLDERQQTMRNTLTWSYDLLSHEQQCLFRRMAVFAGGCTLEAAEAVCTEPEGAEPGRVDVLEGLRTLVDCSLMQQLEREGEPRFSMLHVIREYALELLDASGEGEALRRAHATYFRRLAEPDTLLFGDSAVDLNAVRALNPELDNLRAGLGWSLARADITIGLPLVVSLPMFWDMCGNVTEGRRWVDAFVALVSGDTRLQDQIRNDPHLAQAHVHLLVSAADYALGPDMQRCADLAEVALAAARQIGDTRAEIWTLTLLADASGNVAQCQQIMEQCVGLARTAHDEAILPHVLCVYSHSLNHAGEQARARAAVEEALLIANKLGVHFDQMHANVAMAEIAMWQGDLAEVLPHATEALRLCQAHGFMVNVPRGFDVLARLATSARTYSSCERAARVLGASHALRARFGIEQAIVRHAGEAATVAREVLGEEAWARAYAEGQTLSIEDAFVEALGEHGRHRQVLAMVKRPSA